jgi:hypothetical protein
MGGGHHGVGIREFAGLDELLQPWRCLKPNGLSCLPETGESKAPGALQLFYNRCDQISGGAICGYAGHASGILQDGGEESFGQDDFLSLSSARDSAERHYEVQASLLMPSEISALRWHQHAQSGRYLEVVSNLKPDLDLMRRSR